MVPIKMLLFVPVFPVQVHAHLAVESLHMVPMMLKLLVFYQSALTAQEGPRAWRS